MTGDAVAALIEPLLPDRLGGAPFVLGLCGAQGSGKSTVAARLHARLTAAGRRAAILSLDDLYLSRADRLALAAAVHPLFATRGVPGTHDVALGLRVLGALGGGAPVAIPRFDKAADDRVAPSLVEAPVDIVILEGWCVGARPQVLAALAAPINALEREEDGRGIWRGQANAALASAYAALFARIDRLVLLAAPDFAIVADWRREQEAAIRGSGAHVMDDAAIDRFVAHYERLTRHILATMPAYADLTIRLDEGRRPLSATSPAPSPPVRP